MMTAFLFSCEHATCAVPEAHRELFKGHEEALTSPAGWDPGALNLAQGFSMKYRTPLVHGDVTRLLIDLEASGDNRWSRFTATAPETLRTKLIDRHERPYRLALQQRLAEDLRRHDAVLHVMIHTTEREGGVFLETLPGAALAEEFARSWRAALGDGGLEARHIALSEMSDLARDLSEEFTPERYAVVRLDVAQSFFLTGTPWKWEALKRVLLAALASSAATVVTAPSDSSPPTG
jgi:hypothetical protein